MIYITNDVEAAGNKLGVHAILSLGACVVTREAFSFEELERQGLVFYAELKPFSQEFEPKAMQIGCLGLKCLEGLRAEDPRYEPTHPDFQPELVLTRLQEVGEEPSEALARFVAWMEQIARDDEIRGVVDTAFFDSGFINHLFGLYLPTPSPFGWKGLDLASLYCGHSGNENASLRDLGLLDTRTNPHRADHDAVLLARLAREILYVRLGW